MWPCRNWQGYWELRLIIPTSVCFSFRRHSHPPADRTLMFLCLKRLGKHNTEVKVLIPVCVLSHFSHVQLFAARQAPLSTGFPRQEYWSGLPLPFPPPEDLPDPGIEPESPVSPALQAGSFPTEPPRKSLKLYFFSGDNALFKNLHCTLSWIIWLKCLSTILYSSLMLELVKIRWFANLHLPKSNYEHNV